MTERIEYNKILEVTEDERAIQLLISLKCTAIVTDLGSTIQNTPYYTRRVFYET